MTYIHIRPQRARGTKRTTNRTGPHRTSGFHPQHSAFSGKMCPRLLAARRARLVWWSASGGTSSGLRGDPISRGSARRLRGFISYGSTDIPGCQPWTQDLEFPYTKVNKQIKNSSCNCKCFVSPVRDPLKTSTLVRNKKSGPIVNKILKPSKTCQPMKNWLFIPLSHLWASILFQGHFIYNTLNK